MRDPVYTPEKMLHGYITFVHKLPNQTAVTVIHLPNYNEI